MLFQENKFYMLVLLPYEHSTVQNVISKFKSIIRILPKMKQRKIYLSMPRFNITSDLNLNEQLREVSWLNHKV